MRTIHFAHYICSVAPTLFVGFAVTIRLYTKALNSLTNSNIKRNGHNKQPMIRLNLIVLFQVKSIALLIHPLGPKIHRNPRSHTAMPNARKISPIINMKIWNSIRPPGWLMSDVMPEMLMATIVIAQTIDRKPSKLRNKPANNNNIRVVICIFPFLNPVETPLRVQNFVRVFQLTDIAYVLIGWPISFRHC